MVQWARAEPTELMGLCYVIEIKCAGTSNLMSTIPFLWLAH